MKIDGETLELDLMPNHSIVLTLRYDNAYEAAVVYQDLSEACQAGTFNIEFEVTRRRVIIDRTGDRA